MFLLLHTFAPAPPAAVRAQTRYFTTSALENPKMRRKEGASPIVLCRRVADAGLMRPWPRPERATSIHRPPGCSARGACGKIAADTKTGGPSHTAAQPYNSRRTLAMYQSDITQFINQLKEQKPQLEEQQRKGRALLWDKQPIDLDERERQQASRVRQTSYVYYQNF
jgi:hypothetical protein